LTFIEIEDNFSSVPPKPSATSTATDEEGAVVEDEKKPEDDIILPKTKVPKTREVLKDKWIQLNAQAPIWMRFADIFFYFDVLTSLATETPRK
jgi:hypothetical protein